MKLAYPDSREMAIREIQLAKDAGFNMIRPWRKPPPPMWLDLADEMGVLTVGSLAIECMDFPVESATPPGMGRERGARKHPARPEPRLRGAVGTVQRTETPGAEADAASDVDARPPARSDALDPGRVGRVGARREHVSALRIRTHQVQRYSRLSRTADQRRGLPEAAADRQQDP